MYTQNSIRSNQYGLVSIVVTLVFVSIISVVVLSFAFLIRREQQQVLDRQLSTQAFYAAESGVSEAVANIDSLGDVTECTEKDLSDSVSVSCVLIDQSPSTLEYSDINTSKSEIIRLKSSGSKIDKVEISWEAKDQSKKGIFAENNQYYLPTADFSPPANSFDFSKHIGLVRAEFIGLFNGSNVSRGDLSTNTQVFFLYPADTANTATLAASGGIGSTAAYNDSRNLDGAFVAGNCGEASNTRECQSTISNIRNSAGTSADEVFLRLKAVYQPVTLTIKAFDSNGNQIDLFGQQAVIDSTGKAGSVLRRIQVRVPLRTQYQFPEFALETADDICKRLVVTDASAQDNCPN